MRFNRADIESWASEYADAPDVKGLTADMEADRALPQPSSYPAGSPVRQLAENRQTQLLRRAVALGYQPPIKELVTTITKELVKTELLGAAGLEGTAAGAALDKLPVPEKESEAEKEARRKKKQRDGGIGFGFEVGN